MLFFFNRTIFGERYYCIFLCFSTFWWSNCKKYSEVRVSLSKLLKLGKNNLHQLVRGYLPSKDSTCFKFSFLTVLKTKATAATIDVYLLLKYFWRYRAKEVRGYKSYVIINLVSNKTKLKSFTRWVLGGKMSGWVGR